MRIILILVLLIGTAGAKPFNKSDLVGAWEYVSAYQELADGSRIEQFGQRPRGLFVILRGGTYSHIVLRNNLPKVSSGLIRQMTPHEEKSIAEGTLAHYGTWTADEATGILTVHVIRSSFPNFNGTDQRRTIVELSPTTMKYVNIDTTAGKNSRVYATLRKVSD